MQGTRITNPVVLAQLEAARAALPIEQTNGNGHRSLPILAGPRYRAHVPLWRRFIGKGPGRQGAGGQCAGCAGEQWGWVQRQLMTPRRTVRFLVWFASLVPRGAELVRVLTGGRTTEQQYRERNEICERCEQAVGVVYPDSRVKLYCGGCDCPEWWLAQLPRKNRMVAWECPRHLHPGAYRGDDVRAEVERRRAAWLAAHAPLPHGGREQADTGGGQ